MGSTAAALLRLLPLLLALLGPGSSEDVNALVGTTVELKIIYSGKSTGYTWTKGSTRVAEWDDPGKVTYYESLKGRCDLDTSTGVLTIKDLKEEDSARYKGEALVNNLYVSSIYDLRVFPNLTKPIVTCHVQSGNFTLSCDHQPEPPTYTWRNNGVVVTATNLNYWLSNDNKNLTLANAKVPFQSLECVVQNPVSNNSTLVPLECFEGLIDNEGENNRGRDGFIAAGILCFLAVAGLVVYVRNFSKTPGVLQRQGTGNDHPQDNNLNHPAEQTKLMSGNKEIPLEGRNLPNIDAAANLEMEEEEDVADNARHQKDEDNSQARPNSDPNMEMMDKYSDISLSHHSLSMGDINGDKTASEANRTVKES